MVGTGESALRRLSVSADVAAPRLLGALLTHRTAEGAATVQITEVEAYLGDKDPGSHAFRGLTPRNQPMFGPPGQLYVYFSYGMHWCANVVTGIAGQPSACLLRAGQIVAGLDLAWARRPSAQRVHELACGPARLAAALNLDGSHSGSPIEVFFQGPEPEGLSLRLRRRRIPRSRIGVGPRVGVAGPGGDGERFPLRFWLLNDPTVSPYRRARPR